MAKNPRTFSFLTNLWRIGGEIVDPGLSGGYEAYQAALAAGVPMEDLGTYRRVPGKSPLVGVLAATSTTIAEGKKTDLAQISAGDTIPLNSTRAAKEGFDTFLRAANQIPTDQIVVVNGVAVMICNGNSDTEPELDPAILRQFAHRASVTMKVAGHEVGSWGLNRALDTHQILTYTESPGGGSPAEDKTIKHDRPGAGIQLVKPIVLEPETNFSLIVECQLDLTVASGEKHPIRGYLDTIRYVQSAA